MEGVEDGTSGEPSRLQGYVAQVRMTMTKLMVAIIGAVLVGKGKSRDC